MKIILCCLVVLIAVVTAAYAGSSLFYREFNLIGGFSDRDRWVGKNSELVNSAGFEYFRKFSGEYGDYLTTDLQMRIGYDSMANSRDAWGLQVHNAWLLYKLGQSAKFRFGHFAPAFGLEPQVDTHGTILQTLAMKNIGFKRDWGAGLEGSLFQFDYKTALQLGSGMSIYRKDRSFLVSSRIGSPSGRNLQYGISVLYARVLDSMGLWTVPRGELLSGKAVFKKRAGVDAQYLFGSYLFKAEAAYGENDRDEVLGYSGEVDYTFPKRQNLALELQLQSWRNEPEKRASEDSTLSVGASYKLSQNTTLRAAFSHDLNMAGVKEEDKFLVQFYFFGA
jgi:hypothetical protein